MAKVALLIGVSEYQPEFSPLAAPVKDIEAMKRVLLDRERGEFDEVEILPNRQRQIMEEKMETFFTQGRKKDDLVLLFFSGHGITDDAGRLYFATPETQKNLILSTAVSAGFVHNIMNKSPAKRQVIILDCCYSGAFAKGLQAKGDRSLDLERELGAEGRVVLTSSSFTEQSFQQDEKELSVYTRYLVEGIETGEAAENDGKIYIQGLHDYVDSKVQETASNMTPKIISPQGMGWNIVIAKAPVTDRKPGKIALRANAGRISPTPPRTEKPPDSKDLSKVKDELFQLQQELQGGKWKAADQLTSDILLKLVSRQKERWLRDEDVEKLPQDVLLELDKLWMEASRERFGFSRQKQVWHEVCGKVDSFNYKNLRSFFESVGWQNDRWLEYPLYNFSLQAPPGHLPLMYMREGKKRKDNLREFWQSFGELFNQEQI